MGKTAVKSLEERLRQVLRGCVREGMITILTSSQDLAEVIEAAKVRFLKRIDAAAGKLGLGCDETSVAAVKSRLYWLVDFTVPSGQFAPPVSPKPRKRHGKPKATVSSRERGVTVLVTLRPNYTQTLSLVVADHLTASSATQPANLMSVGKAAASAVGAAGSFPA